MDWLYVQKWATEQIELARAALETVDGPVEIQRGRIKALRELLDLPNTARTSEETKIGTDVVGLTGGPLNYT